METREPPRRPLRVGILHNPLSGRHGGGAAAIERARAATPALDVRPVRTPASVGAALASLAAEGADVVVVSGGDGTVQAALTALLGDRPFETLPLLAIVPGGTANMIAGDVGVRGGGGALRRILAWAGDPGRRPAVVRRPVIRVQAAPDAAPAFGMFVGTGAIYAGTRYCLDRLHPRGIRGQLAPAVALLRYALAAAAGRAVPTVPLAMSVDGESAGSGPHLLAFVTTLERLVLGLRPFWGVGPGGLRLTAVAAQPVGLLRALPALLRGRPAAGAGPPRGYVSRNAREVRLHFDGGFTLDGQLLAASARRGPVVLSDGGSVRFVRC